MKVFISHASTDQEDAAIIQRQLEGIGVDAFLDKKNIPSGGKFQQFIFRHLGEVDHVLILVSRAALASQWVLIELGGALALKKHIVPIMKDVGVNDLPSCIQDRHARRIERIGRYYEELQDNQDGASPSTTRSERRPKSQRITTETMAHMKPGKQVRVIDQANPVTRRELNWTKDMDRFCGKVVTIAEVLRSPWHAVRIEEDNQAKCWAYEWLTPVSGDS